MWNMAKGTHQKRPWGYTGPRITGLWPCACGGSGGCGLGLGREGCVGWKGPRECWHVFCVPCTPFGPSPISHAWGRAGARYVFVRSLVVITQSRGDASQWNGPPPTALPAGHAPRLKAPTFRLRSVIHSRLGRYPGLDVWLPRPDVWLPDSLHVLPRGPITQQRRFHLPMFSKTQSPFSKRKTLWLTDKNQTKRKTAFKERF